MAKRSELPRALSGLTLLVFAVGTACSSQTSPAPGVLSPTAPVGSPTAPRPSPLPALTPSGVVSARPGDVPSASASSQVLAPPASAAEVPRPRAQQGKLCGGFAGILCAEKLYCSYPLSAKCGAGDMAGTCQPIADLCTMVFAPVCGCDGKTYASACVAGRGGVSVAKNGPCPGDSGSGIPEGKLCGTRGVVGECGQGLYCAYRSQCGATDAGGSCQKKPELCPHLVAPVCGCDTKTYNNACEAARVGVSVATRGACKVQ